MTEARDLLVPTALFSLVALLVGGDVLSDAGSGVGVPHLTAEGLATGLALVGVAWGWTRLRRERAEAAVWRARAEELLAGLGQGLDDQFDAWKLTGAEREVALLLLKGLSFKEIGAVRDTSERTSREQARGVYAKAGVAGRAELSAWFVEEWLAKR